MEKPTPLLSTQPHRRKWTGHHSVGFLWGWQRDIMNGLSVAPMRSTFFIILDLNTTMEMHFNV